MTITSENLAGSIFAATVPAATGPRSIAAIAREIRRDWKAPYFGAVPYLDRYLEDSGKSVVMYFLSNATTWKGDVARRVKAELKSMLK